MTTPAESIQDLITDLDGLGIAMTLHGGRIRLRPSHLVTPDILDRVKGRKRDLITALSVGQSNERFPGGDTGDGDETPRHDSANRGSVTVATVAAPKLAIAIPPGWTGPAWAVELQRKADRCRAMHPARAADFERDAATPTPPPTTVDSWLWDIITEDQKQCRTNAKYWSRTKSKRRVSIVPTGLARSQ